MKPKTYIYIFCICLISGLSSCSEPDGKQPPPFLGLFDNFYFRGMDGKDLLAQIKIDSILSGTDGRYYYTIEPPHYHLKYFIDNRPSVFPLYDTLVIQKDSANNSFITLSLTYKTEYYRKYKVTHGHNLRYEFYCPVLFKDEKTHIISIDCDMKGIFFTQKTFQLDNTEGKLLFYDKQREIPSVEFTVN